MHYMSDHAAVHVGFNLSKPQKPTEEITYHKTKSIDPAAFARDIQASSLLHAPSSSLEDLVHQYDKTLASLLEKHAPLKCRTITIRPNNPWHNCEIIASKKACRRMERRWRRTKLSEDRHLFQEKREVLHALINKSKSDYYLDKIANCSDQKQLFRVIEELMPKAKPKLPSHESTVELAKAFNTYFIQKIENIRESLDKGTTVETVAQSPLCNQNVLKPVASTVAALSDFKPASVEEVVKIDKSSPTKSCDLDPIPTWLLKKHIDDLGPVITRLLICPLRTVFFHH